MQIIENLHGFIWRSMSANNCNTYLIDGPTRILIDPGHLRLFDHVEEGLGQLGLDLGQIGLVICTHGHPDHLEAARLFKDRPALVAIHEQEWDALQSMGKQIRAAMGVDLDDLAPDLFLTEGELNVDGMDLRIFHAPGHSPGSAAVYWPDRKAMFTGDVIFKGGLGRTDLPGGDGRALKQSIQRLSELDVEYLLSGHGEAVIGAGAVRDNFASVERQWFGYI
jgi:hydroxyacylglutathione hydrolase